MDAKLCVICGQALPEFRRSNRRYCSGLCRVRAFRIRAGIGIRGRHLHRESSYTAAKLAGGATAALALVALNRKLEQERAERLTQENHVAELRDQLTRTQEALDAATKETQQLRDANRQLEGRRKLAHEGTIAQLLKELAGAHKSLDGATRDFKELHAEWNDAERRCAKMRRQLEAYRSTRHGTLSLSHSEKKPQQRQLAKARARNRELGQAVRQLKGQLAASERQHARLEAPSRREAALAAHVDSLQRQLEELQDQDARLHGKVKRLKKRNARLLDQTEADAGPSAILGGVAKALGFLGAGAAVGHQVGKQLERASASKPPRLPAGHVELPPASPSRALPAKSRR